MPQRIKQGRLFMVPIRGDDDEYQRIMDALTPRERTEVLLGTVSKLVVVPITGTLESDKKPPAQ